MEWRKKDKVVIGLAKPINPFILFWKFCKIGIITFGGGYDRPVTYRTIHPRRCRRKYGLFCGHRIGSKGAAIAAFGVISHRFCYNTHCGFFSRFCEYSAVQNTFIGVLCAVVALIIKSVYSMAKLAILDIPTIIITIITVVGLLVFKSLSPVFFIIGGVIVGLLFYYLFPKKARQLQLKDGEIDD